MVGQLKAYSSENHRDKKLCAVFFGECNYQKKMDIVTFLQSEDIDVYELEEDKNDVISLKLLRSNKIVDQEKYAFFMWGQDNIVRSNNRNVLTISEILKLYTNKEISKTVWVFTQE